MLFCESSVFEKKIPDKKTNDSTKKPGRNADKEQQNSSF